MFATIWSRFICGVFSFVFLFVPPYLFLIETHVICFLYGMGFNRQSDYSLYVVHGSCRAASFWSFIVFVINRPIWIDLVIRVCGNVNSIAPNYMYVCTHRNQFEEHILHHNQIHFLTNWIDTINHRDKSASRHFSSSSLSNSHQSNRRFISLRS